MRSFGFIALILCGLPFVGTAQTVDATIDRREILIGEQAVIRLSVNYPKDRVPDVLFPDPANHLPEKVEILSTKSIDTLETGADVSTTRMERAFTVTSFDSGYYAFPPFDFVINGDTQRTEAFLLKVKTVEIDTTAGPKNIKDIYPVEVTWKDYLSIYSPYILGGLGLLVAVLASIWYIRKRLKAQREKPDFEPTEEALPADQMARKELERIGRERIYTRGLVKKYHTEITDVIRDYLESAADIPAHELTSRQILQRLKYSGIGEKEMRSLRELLVRADMVKFAKETPGEQENEAAILQAMVFVDGTASIWLNSENEKDDSPA